MAGVRQGMDSVHIDLSISKDGVPFLLRDHDPRSLTAGLRQLGVWGVARCRPAMASDSLVPAHDKPWKQVRSAWHYVGQERGSGLVTYQDWLEGVARLNRGLRSIWLEFRVPSFLLARMVKIVWDITVMAGMEDKLYFRMDQSGKLRMNRNIVFVSGLDMDVKSLSAEQRE